MQAYDRALLAQRSQRASANPEANRESINAAKAELKKALNAAKSGRVPAQRTKAFMGTVAGVVGSFYLDKMEAQKHERKSTNGR